MSKKGASSRAVLVSPDKRDMMQTEEMGSDVTEADMFLLHVPDLCRLGLRFSRSS